VSDPRLTLALSLAREAGRQAVASLGAVTSVWKRPGERLTRVDIEIQSRMLETIQTGFPHDGIVAEESGGRLGIDDRATLWDVAGGAALLLEADGFITTPCGAPLFPVDLARQHGDPMPFAAGNAAAHAEAVATLRSSLHDAAMPRART